MALRAFSRSGVESQWATVTELDTQASKLREEAQALVAQNAHEFLKAECDLRLANNDLARQYWTAFDEYSLLAAQRLELAFVASFGFRASVGLLIGWSEYFRDRDRLTTHRELTKST